MFSSRKVTMKEKDIILKRKKRSARSSALFAISKTTMLLSVKRRKDGKDKTQHVATIVETQLSEFATMYENVSRLFLVFLPTLLSGLLGTWTMVPLAT